MEQRQELNHQRNLPLLPTKNHCLMTHMTSLGLLNLIFAYLCLQTAKLPELIFQEESYVHLVYQILR